MTAVAAPAGPAAPGLLAHVESSVGQRVAAEGLRPQAAWTIEATVPDLSVRDGVIAAVIGHDGEIVRALLVRHGQLGVLGWSWRGGKALWSETLGPREPGARAHVAATCSDLGDLMVYVDGDLLRVFTTRGLVSGSHPQRVLLASPVRFANETIPGWPRELRDLALYERVLTPEEIRQRARAALDLPEPVQPAPAPRPVEPVGCENPSHFPAWRPDGKRVRCLQCDPPRGCSHDEHEPYWRPAGSDMRTRADWWKLVCSYCETAARRASDPTHKPGEAS